VHNMEYALELLDKTTADTDEIIRMAAENAAPPSSGGVAP